MAESSNGPPELRAEESETGSYQEEDVSTTVRQYLRGERLGDFIGPYRLLKVLGEGGFGRVYLAERREPYVQRVALKLISRPVDREILARFDQERQALAVMDHPHLARIYDGGTTEDGKPYFVMEHVQGEPITTYCDRHCLSIRKRLDLFMLVCEAVQHAHNRSVIHRDLKPSNILVTHSGNRVVPKVIDFGLAKAINPRFIQQTLVTQTGQFMGTIEYMSPEQAEMTNTNVDFRADVYSLGVVLYELLIGVLPIPSDVLRSSDDRDTVSQRIRKTTILKPSVRLRQGGCNWNHAAARRDATVEHLRRCLHAGLDKVVMRALQKDRSERFETPQAIVFEIRSLLSRAKIAAKQAKAVAPPPPVGSRPPVASRRNEQGGSWMLRFQPSRWPRFIGPTLGGLLLVILVIGFVGYSRAANRPTVDPEVWVAYCHGYHSWAGELKRNPVRLETLVGRRAATLAESVPRPEDLLPYGCEPESLNDLDRQIVRQRPNASQVAAFNDAVLAMQQLAQDVENWQPVRRLERYAQDRMLRDVPGAAQLLESLIAEYKSNFRSGESSSTGVFATMERVDRAVQTSRELQEHSQSREGLLRNLGLRDRPLVSAAYERIRSRAENDMDLEQFEEMTSELRRLDEFVSGIGQTDLQQSVDQCETEGWTRLANVLTRLEDERAQTLRSALESGEYEDVDVNAERQSARELFPQIERLWRDLPSRDGAREILSSVSSRETELPALEELRVIRRDLIALRDAPVELAEPPRPPHAAGDNVSWTVTLLNIGSEQRRADPRQSEVARLRSELPSLEKRRDEAQEKYNDAQRRDREAIHGKKERVSPAELNALRSAARDRATAVRRHNFRISELVGQLRQDPPITRTVPGVPDLDDPAAGDAHVYQFIFDGQLATRIASMGTGRVTIDGVVASSTLRRTEVRVLSVARLNE